MIDLELGERANRRPIRSGISLIEVIAAIALVSAIVIPMAGLMRTSARVSERTLIDQDREKTHRALRWIRRQWATSTLVAPPVANQVIYQAADGRTKSIVFRGGTIRLIDSGDETTLIDDVDGVRMLNLVPQIVGGNLDLDTIEVEIVHRRPDGVLVNYPLRLQR